VETEVRSKNGLSRETGNYGHKIQTKQANKTCHATQKTKQMSITDPTKKTWGEPRCSRRKKKQVSEVVKIYFGMPFYWCGMWKRHIILIIGFIIQISNSILVFLILHQFYSYFIFLCLFSIKDCFFLHCLTI
jgi:hypothetical protein